MFRIVILLALVIGIFTTLSVLIPDSITLNIDSSIVYFLNSIWSLNSLVNVSTILQSFKILAYFYSGLSVFWIFHWVFRIIK